MKPDPIGGFAFFEEEFRPEMAWIYIRSSRQQDKFLYRLAVMAIIGVCVLVLASSSRIFFVAIIPFMTGI